MELPTSQNYENIEIYGPVTMKPHEGVIVEGCALLVLGPTGAGKSTLIEALANNGSLHISSNQLEGFTKSITKYQVHNAGWRGRRIVLLDVPGFADTKISEMSIIAMLRKAIKSGWAKSFNRILYLTPIDRVRLPGSHRQVLKTIQALTGTNAAWNITIVSTMWDTIYTDSARERAESNFNQLRDDIWKDFISQGTQIVKFHNTQRSALSVVDISMGGLSSYGLSLDKFISYSQRFHETPFGNSVYNDLQTRIQSLQTQQANIRMELEGTSSRVEPDLVTFLTAQLEEAEMYLAKVNEELQEFGPPPVSSGSIPHMLTRYEWRQAETQSFPSAYWAQGPSARNILHLPQTEVGLYHPSTAAKIRPTIYTRPASSQATLPSGYSEAPWRPHGDTTQAPSSRTLEAAHRNGLQLVYPSTPPPSPLYFPITLESPYMTMSPDSSNTTPDASPEEPFTFDIIPAKQGRLGKVLRSIKWWGKAFSKP